jgi:hypothetical protein
MRYVLMGIIKFLSLLAMFIVLLSCKKETFISGKYLLESDLTYVSVYGDTFDLADREMQLIKTCDDCDILEFKYSYDAQNAEQKFKENTYILHVFDDSVFGNWSITVGPEYSNGFYYHSYFFLEGNIFRKEKEYSVVGNISTIHNNAEYSSWFSIKSIK